MSSPGDQTGRPDAGHDPGYGRPPGYGQPSYGQSSYGPAAYGPSAYGPEPGYGPGYGPAHPGGYGYPAGPPPGPKPSTNIGWAIAAIFLFWPLCIPAFIFATRVDSAWFAGDYYGAQKASGDAKKYGMIGVIVGGCIIALYLLLFITVFATIGTG